MALSDYTSLNDVRAVLGVSTDEIEDSTLSLPLYEFGLVAELEDVSLDLITDYAAQKATPEVDWTALQVRLHQSIWMFSTYAVAKQLTSSLPLFSPKEITDGKASVVRYAQNPYEATIFEVGKQYEVTKTRLAAAYAASKLESAPVVQLRSYMAAVVSGYDPVTGE